MTEEIGAHFRISIVIVMTASLVGVVAAVLVFSLKNFGNQTEHYSTAMTMSATASIHDLQKERYVTCPQAYSSIVEAGDEIREVIYYETKDGTGKTIYKYDGSVDNLIWLLTTEQSRENVRIVLEQDKTDRTPSITVHITKIKPITI